MPEGSAANTARRERLSASAFGVRVAALTTPATTMKIAPARRVPPVAVLARLVTVSVVPVSREHSHEALLDEVDDAVDEALLAPRLAFEGTAVGLLGAPPGWSALALDHRESALEVT